MSFQYSAKVPLHRSQQVLFSLEDSQESQKSLDSLHFVESLEAGWVLLFSTLLGAQYKLKKSLGSLEMDIFENNPFPKDPFFHNPDTAFHQPRRLCRVLHSPSHGSVFRGFCSAFSSQARFCNILDFQPPKSRHYNVSGYPKLCIAIRGVCQDLLTDGQAAVNTGITLCLSMPRFFDNLVSAEYALHIRITCISDSLQKHACACTTVGEERTRKRR